MPIACRIARSCANGCSLPAAISSPAIATTKVLPWYAWMCGATVRNHGTNVWGKTRFNDRPAYEKMAAILACRWAALWLARQTLLLLVEKVRQPQADLRE